jgi:hypothetical protein
VDYFANVVEPKPHGPGRLGTAAAVQAEGSVKHSPGRTGVIEAVEMLTTLLSITSGTARVAPTA